MGTFQADAWNCANIFIDRYLQPSDEEVLGYEDSDEEDPVDDDIDSAGEDRVDSEEKKKMEYKTGAPRKQTTTMQTLLKRRPMRWRKKRRPGDYSRSNCRL